MTVRVAGTAVAGAIIGAAIMWPVSSLAASNLGSDARQAVEVVLVFVAAFCGLLCCGLVGRRGHDSHLVGFGATVGALGGAACGATFTIVIGIAYVATFGGAPGSFLDAVALGLSFPIFGLLGATAGGTVGAVVGLLAGYSMGRLPLRSQRELP